MSSTRETLLLRLLGCGAVLERALEEQASLDLDAPERRAVRAALLAVADEPVSIRESVEDPVLHACRKIYQRWGG